MIDKSLKQIDVPCRMKASQAIGLLHGNRGVSLIEVMMVSFILALMIVTIYMGVIYAETQILQNYRHRQATLIASGEVEKHYVRFRKMHSLDSPNSYDVELDNTEDTPIVARVSITKGQAVEHNVAKQYPYFFVTAEVRWTDPYTEKTNTVKIREDFYDVEGSSN